MLKFHKLCHRWANEVDNNPDIMADATAFRSSLHVQNAVRTVTQLAGLLAASLNASDVHLMYSLCAFETAWLEWPPSAWCSLFDEHAARVFEYLEDLEYYQFNGFGNELTYRQACPALNDMLDRMLAPVPAATFYFVHSGTVLKMLALLGLYRDEIPLAGDGFEASTARSWRLSRIDPFGNNVAFVLYK